MNIDRHAERLKAMLDATSGTIAIGGKVDVDEKFMEPTIITGGLVGCYHEGNKGRKVDVDEKFMEPTIITGVDWSDATMKVQ